MSEHELVNRLRNWANLSLMQFVRVADEVEVILNEHSALKLIKMAAIEVDRIAQLDPRVEEYDEWLSVWHKALEGLHALLGADNFIGGTVSTYFNTERTDNEKET